MFQSWKSKYNKKYGASQKDSKFEVFKSNLKYIEEHNAQGYSFTLGQTLFMDLTFEVMQKLHTGFQAAPSAEERFILANES